MCYCACLHSVYLAVCYCGTLVCAWFLVLCTLGVWNGFRMNTAIDCGYKRGSFLPINRYPLITAFHLYLTIEMKASTRLVEFNHYLFTIKRQPITISFLISACAWGCHGAADINTSMVWFVGFSNLSLPCCFKSSMRVFLSYQLCWHTLNSDLSLSDIRESLTY